MATAARTELDSISSQIISAAIKVHIALGPGLLESAYEAFLAHELRKQGLAVETQVALPVTYDGVTVDLGYRIDLKVANSVLVELKAVEGILPVHRAQLLSYLRLSDRRLGLLINFHTVRLKDGIVRIVNNY